jgi:hypothetical protein
MCERLARAPGVAGGGYSQAGRSLLAAARNHGSAGCRAARHPAFVDQALLDSQGARHETCGVLELLDAFGAVRIGDRQGIGARVRPAMDLDVDLRRASREEPDHFGEPHTQDIGTIAVRVEARWKITDF